MKAAGWIAASSLLVCWLLHPTPTQAQAGPADGASSPRGWVWGATGMISAWTKESDAFDRLGGPGAHLGWVWPRNVGFELRAGYLMPTGFYGLSGIWGQLAFTYSVPAGDHLVQLKGGGAGFFGGDSDGSIGAAGGPLVGTGLLLRLASRFGIQVDGFTQLFYQASDWVVSPGVAVSVVLLPRGR